MKHCLILILMLATARTASAENILFPPDAGAIDVKAKYGAKGDGSTDDTQAIQKAIDEVKGIPDTLYFPNTVDGFDHGVETGDTFSLVFEHLTLKNQNVLGFDNGSARTTLRDLKSVNAVPALKNGRNGQMTLVEADLSGGDKEATAILSEGCSHKLM